MSSLTNLFGGDYKKRSMGSSTNKPIIGTPVMSDALISILNTSSAPANIVYGSGVYAGIISGNIYTSSDGLTWTSRLTGNSLNILFFSNSLFITLQSSGSYSRTFYTSPDGISWTTRTMNLSNLGVYPEVALLSSVNGTSYLYSSGLNYWYVSTNGTTWNPYSVPLSPADGTSTYLALKGIHYSNSLYCLLTVYYSEDFSPTPYLFSIFTSTNGTTWIYRSIFPQSDMSNGYQSIMSLCNFLLIEIRNTNGANYYQSLKISYDGGLNFNQIPTCTGLGQDSWYPTPNWFSYSKINGAIIAYQQNTGAVYRSADAISWLKHNIGAPIFSNNPITSDNPMNLQTLFTLGAYRLCSMNPQEAVFEKF